VMTYRNAPRLKSPAPFGSSPTAAAASDLPIMQDDRLHWNGQPIAVVLAETQAQADYATSLIVATYVAEPSTTSFAAAKVAGSQPAVFMGQPLLNEIGDAEAMLATAPHKIDHVYRTPRHNHNAIEPHAATILWKMDELTIHDTTQMVTAQAATIAGVFGLKAEQVRVISPYVGGGFGGKGLADHQILGAAAAKMIGRPVRVTLSRAGVYRIVGGRTLTEQRVAIGAQANGHLSALIHAGTVAMTAHNNMPEPFIMGTRAAYAADSFKLSVETVTMNMLANIFMRAGRIGRHLCAGIGDRRVGDRASDGSDRAAHPQRAHKGPDLEFALLVAAYRPRLALWRRAVRLGPAQRGTWQATRGRVADRLRLRNRDLSLLPDAGRCGTDHADSGRHGHRRGGGARDGHGHGNDDRDRIEVHYGDSIIPGAILAGGSQQTAAIGGAVIAAYRALVGELLKLAGSHSPLAGLSIDEVESDSGGLAKLGEPARRETYASILDHAKRNSVTAAEKASLPLEMMHWSMHSHGAMFCEVWGNAVTAETRVSRFLGSFDTGRIINPKTARSQFRGGIIMGIGMALMEETQFDERNGRIMNPSLAEYHIPVHMDVPEIDVIWTDIADPHTPMGAHGIGEIGITGVGAAVANAVYNATGRRVRQLPITLDKLL
jgi:xanthine dehydrogenase YagR molybdenum-binding subunit